MPSSVHNSTSGFSTGSHSSDQTSSSSVQTVRSFSSLESYPALGNDMFSSPPSSQDLSSVTSMSSRSTSEDFDIHEYQTSEISMSTVSTASSTEMRGDSLTGSYSSSRDLEDIVVSGADAPSYSMNQLMEQEDEEPVTDTSEWRELLDALEVERSRTIMFHSMSAVERFLSYETVEDCLVEFRVWGAEE